MPQLDLLTFFPQFFWSFIFFISFFFYFSYCIIPSIATPLKLRKQKLITLADEINKKKDDSSHLLIEYDNLAGNSFDETKKKLDKVMLNGTTWSNSKISTLNRGNLSKITLRFLKNCFEKESNELIKSSISKASRTQKKMPKKGPKRK